MPFLSCSCCFGNPAACSSWLAIPPVRRWCCGCFPPAPAGRQPKTNRKDPGGWLPCSACPVWLPCPDLPQGVKITPAATPEAAGCCPRRTRQGLLILDETLINSPNQYPSRRSRGYCFIFFSRSISRLLRSFFGGVCLVMFSDGPFFVRFPF